MAGKSAPAGPAQKPDFFETNIFRIGGFVGKVAATAGAAWVVTHLTERLSGVPGMSPESLGHLAQALVIGLGGTWILKPAGFWKRAGMTGTIMAAALAGNGGANLARDQLAPSERGSINVAPVIQQLAGPGR